MDLSSWTIDKLKKRLTKARRATGGNKAALVKSLQDYFAEGDYVNWTVEELRATLRARGESTQGKKAELVQRAQRGDAAVREEAQREEAERPKQIAERAPRSRPAPVDPNVLAVRLHMRQLVGNPLTPALAKQLEQAHQQEALKREPSSFGVYLPAVRQAPFVVEVGTRFFDDNTAEEVSETRVQRTLDDIDALSDFVELMAQLFWPSYRPERVFGELYENGKFDDLGRGNWFIKLV